MQEMQTQVLKYIFRLRSLAWLLESIILRIAKERVGNRGRECKAHSRESKSERERIISSSISNSSNGRERIRSKKS